MKWAFLVHYQWLARWFAAQATVLHRVYRGPRALTEDGDEPPARESSRSSRSGSRSTRRLMWLPDCLPSLRRNLLEICRVLQTPLPGILEERISELQAELERFDSRLNDERARGTVWYDGALGLRRWLEAPPVAEVQDEREIALARMLTRSPPPPAAASGAARGGGGPASGGRGRR